MDYNFEICKKLSKEVYNKNLAFHIDGWQRLDSEECMEQGNAYKKFNFACASYIKEKEIIIAFRGTNDAIDIVTDLNFVFKDIPKLTPKFARAFYNKLKIKYPDCKFYLTGHSLGGAYAQLLCAQLVKEYDVCKAITFNAPGMAYALDDKNANKILKYSNIKNYVVMNDFVGNFKAHIGETYYIQPYPLDRINANGKKETSHGCILSYNEKTFGTYFAKPIGFGTKEA